ncbi:tRNA pseudouridine(13) synthase TruD [Vibrio rumoiensis]|uniref:tRNA pseudouridine synthase D n=1 Tax=Vibrio rumoiensis 1S-45 TaxID=1188252 RepID=A0A1E5E4N6_9VIBR|nr:tRNA pseudouridine(13) synthase TruD [Vibrio rumoiensis]OEF27798.1 tRNA pseudouridine(13) synthase TruD [Vibrio rumoiensis 1S-45]
MTDILAPFAYLLGKPTAQAKVKAQAKDFQVIEDLGFAFSGEGEHFMVKIRKEGENTAYVANELAKACGVSSKSISWAGLKDRHAVTEQWLSVHLPKIGDELDIATFEAQHPSVKILETARHNKKLRPGDLVGNGFVIRLVEVTHVDDVVARLEKVKSLGVPNYFGSQRFGREGNNLSEARRWGRDNVRTRNQNQRSLYLSTARSWIFNHIVSHRIELQCFHQLLDGDLVHNTNDEQLLVDEQNLETLQQQLNEKVLQLTAALAGDNALPTENKAEALETQFLDAEPDLMKLIRGNRMRHDRRPVALYADNMSWQVDGSDVVVSFSLPSGSFATSILREVVNEIEIERVYNN